MQNSIASLNLYYQMQIVFFLTAPDPLIVAGNSFPGVCPDWVALRWNLPTEAQQCITNYHLDILTERGSWNTSVTGTVAAVNILSSECCLRHTFTVTPIYLLTGPRDTSDPVSFIPAQSGKAVMYVPDHLHVPMVTHNHTILFVGIFGLNSN